MGARAGLDGAENLTGIRSPGRPTRNESLYRLSYRYPLDSLGNLPYFQANLADKTNSPVRQWVQYCALHFPVIADGWVFCL